MARRVIAIAAMDENRVIGLENRLPWNIPEDLKYFAECTTGHAVLMGRKTWDSLPPKFKPLPGRLNIVCTRTPESLVVPGEVVVTDSPQKAVISFLDGTLHTPTDTLWIVGGEQMYRETLPLWTELYLTKVHSKHSGDAFFPQFEHLFALVDSDDRKGFSFGRYAKRQQM